MWNLKTTNEHFYKHYLQVLNGILKLTRTEQSVLAQFMDIKNSLDETNLSEELKNSLLFSSDNRKNVQDKLNMSEHNLNNYIKMLRDKQMIIGESINPKIYIKKHDGSQISFKLSTK